MNRYTALLARPAELTNILNNPAVQYERWRASLYQHVLAYNNNLAFGHINISRSKDVDVQRIVKCNNLINYVLWDYNAPAANMPRLHGQLFTIPPEEARPRLDEISREKKLEPDLLDALLRILRENHPLAVTYQSAAETYQQLPPEERLNLRMLLVDTNKQGEERTISDQVAQAPPLHFADRANVQQIHPGRLSVETVAGSRLVAQFYLDSGANVMPPSVYDVVFMGRNDTKMVQMKWWNRQIDPALFPLLFPCGQFGYEYGIKLTLRENEAFDSAYKQIRGADTKLLNAKEELGEEEEFLGEEYEQQFHRRDRVSRSQWFRYFCHIRGLNYNWRDSHWLWDWRTLAQLYTITFNNRMEAQKVQFMKQLQGRRRLVRLEGEIGRIYMTDEHFRGSRQYYQREYANCMTICRDIGKPDLLITFTMDPDCAELQELLSVDANDNRQQWYDRPDIVCRLFIDKLKEMHKDLTQREVMGPVRGWFYSLEHQKRGLPHVHFALILDWDRMRSNGTINSPEEYIEQYISAEIPENLSGRSADVLRQRELYKTITTKNIHTCSAQRCLADGKCTKHFPKPFSYANVYSENHYPRYRRRPPAPSDKEAQQHPEKWGRYIQYADKRGKLITKDNRHVVPYNGFLSAKYKSHINTEFVAGEGCTKYLCKYVMKGADMAFIEVQATGDQQKKIDYDEFHQVRLARYITSMEAYLSLWGSPLVQRSHVVDELDVHGPHGLRIAVEQGFKDEEEDRNKICEAAQREEERRATGEERVSQLTAYFTYNQQHQPLGLTYATCYKKLRYDRTKKQWQASIVQSVCGVDDVQLATNLRLHMFGLLQRILEDQTCYPRGHFGNYSDFIQSISDLILVADENFNSYIEQRIDPFNWAKIHDAVFAALLLQRPIVVVNPALYQEITRERPTLHDTSYVQNLNVYFPDGHHLRMRRDVPLEQLGHFTARDRRNRERQVINPVVIWYNGHDHFQTLSFTPPVPNAAEGSEAITSLELQIPQQLLEEAEEPMEIEVLPQPQVVLPSVSSMLEEERDAAEIERSFESYDEVFLDDTFQQMQLCKWCDGVVIPAAAAATADNEMKQQSKWDGFIDLRCCGHFHRRNQTPASFEIKRLHEYEDEDDNCPNCHQRVGSTPHGTTDPTSTLTKSSESAAQKEQQETTLLSPKLSTSTESSVQQTVRISPSEQTSLISSRHGSTESAGSASSSEDSILRRAAALVIQLNEQRTQRQNVGAANTVIRAAVDQQQRQQLLQLFADQIRRDSEQSKKTHLANIGVASANKTAQDLFNIIRRFITLWYNMLQVDAHSASNDELILWLRNSPEMHYQLRKLQEAWEIAAEKLERKIKRAKTGFKLHGTNPLSPTGLKLMLKNAVRTRKRGSAHLSRPLTSIAASSVATAAEKRLRECGPLMGQQQQQCDEEQSGVSRRTLAEKRMNGALQYVEHLCNQHVERLKNLPVRNLTWDREAAIERELASQQQQHRKKVKHILRRALAAGDLNLADYEAVRQLTDELISSAIFEVDAQHQEVVNQQNAIIREQKRREEEQRGKELQQQRMLAEIEFQKQREEEEKWMAHRSEPIEELERLARIEAYGFDPKTEQSAPVTLAEQRDLLQQVGVAQPEAAALQAQEHIEQQLQFASGDYVEEVEVAGKKGEDKGPTPHPHFASLAYDILTARREQILHRNEPNCSICREPFRVGDLVTRLHPDALVKHIFHTICLRRWLTTSHTCPMCRKDVEIEQIIPPNHEHLNAFNEYVAREQQQPNATMRLRDNEFVSRAWHLYEQLRQPQRDAYGSQIGRGLEPEAAFRQVMGFINRGRFDMFGGEQLIWDASDPRNDAAAGTHICKHILQDKLNEDRRKN
uniref:RING-type domain-containing protein n=1 Tax=Globodera pallida TaxID=36090 RepID=A0A183BU25_GLOPA